MTLNDEIDLFPLGDDSYATTDKKNFPIHKITVAQKFSNLSFHNSMFYSL